MNESYIVSFRYIVGGRIVYGAVNAPLQDKDIAIAIRNELNQCPNIFARVVEHSTERVDIENEKQEN